MKRSKALVTVFLGGDTREPILQACTFQKFKKTIEMYTKKCYNRKEMKKRKGDNGIIQFY